VRVRDFPALVDLLLLSLADGDFSAYFARVEARGTDLARTQAQYEDFVLSFHLFEDATLARLTDLSPAMLPQTLSALDHLYHNDIALLARAYFREQDQEREKFYHILTHDLKNSLTSVIGCTDLLLKQLRREDCTANSQELAQDIRRATGRIENLIGSALTYGQLKSGAVQLKLRSIDLEQLTYETLLEGHGLVVEEDKCLLFQGQPLKDWRPDEELPPLQTLGDEGLLYRAVLNLLANAVKYARQTITVSVKRLPELLRLEVCDDGPGVPEAYRERVFDDYFQPPGSRPGTGLGLPSVRRIARLHQGRCGVQPLQADGGGSCFWLELPIVTKA